MKKLMIFAVAAIALVACSKEFDTNKSASNGTAIGFGTWAETLTKARTQGTSTFVDDDVIIVEGVKDPSGSADVVFDNTEVEFDGTDWSYDNTRYWDHQAPNYIFYAVSCPNTVLTLDATGLVSATDVTFSGSNNDILIANSVTVAEANYGDPVALDFHHIAALFDLKVKKTAALADATVEVTGVSLTGLDGTGKVAVTGYTSNVPDVAWTNLDAATTYTNASGVGGTVTLPDDVAQTPADALISNLIVIPQTLTNTKLLVISYTITDGAGNVNEFNNVEIKLNQFDGVDNTVNVGDPDGFITSWSASTHYTYTLTIAAEAITFEADITDWASPVTSGYHYLLQ